MDRPQEEREPRPSTSRPLSLSATFERLSCQVMRVISTQNSTLEADAVKVVNWHTHVQVANPAVICAFQESTCTRDALQLTDISIKGRSSSTLRDQLRTDVGNYANKRLKSGTHTKSMLVFALPLLRVPVTGIHLFRGKAKNENRPLKANARATIRRCQYMWKVKLTVDKITWNRRRDPNIEGGQFFTTDFIFSTELIPLTVVDAMDQLACSDGHTHVQKAETVGSENLIRVFLINLSHHPPQELFLQLSVYSHRAEVMCRHNPTPFFQRHSDNGFIVKNTKGVTIPAHHTHVAHFNNAFETQNTCSFLFFPVDIPGLSMECGPLQNRMKITIKMQNLTKTEISVSFMQTIGVIHFFPRGTLYTMPNKTLTSACSQIRLRAGLCPRESIARGISQFAEQHSSSSEDEDDDLPGTTPPIVTEAIFNPFQSENESTSDEDDERKKRGGRPATPHISDQLSPTSMLLTLPCWNIYMHLENLMPITASVEDNAVKNTSYLKSEMDGDICTAADIDVAYQTLLAPFPLSHKSPSRPRV
ncbi:Ba110 [Baboon cytomegalovirus]|nr:Ba110 [Baboon cytomegalovirus]